MVLWRAARSALWLKLAETDTSQDKFVSKTNAGLQLLLMRGTCHTARVMAPFRWKRWFRCTLMQKEHRQKPSQGPGSLLIRCSSTGISSGNAGLQAAALVANCSVNRLTSGAKPSVQAPGLRKGYGTHQDRSCR